MTVHTDCVTEKTLQLVCSIPLFRDLSLSKVVLGHKEYGIRYITR